MRAASNGQSGGKTQGQRGGRKDSGEGRGVQRTRCRWTSDVVSKLGEGGAMSSSRDACEGDEEEGCDNIGGNDELGKRSTWTGMAWLLVGSTYGRLSMTWVVGCSTSALTGYGKAVVVCSRRKEN